MNPALFETEIEHELLSAYQAANDQLDGGGNGGLLNISFNEIPPPPTVDIAVNRFGRVNARTGVATISGTYTCTNGDFIDVFVDARQRVGRFTILGLEDSSNLARAMEHLTTGRLTSSQRTVSSPAVRR